MVASLNAGIVREGVTAARCGADSADSHRLGVLGMVWTPRLDDHHVPVVGVTVVGPRVELPVGTTGVLRQLAHRSPVSTRSLWSFLKSSSVTTVNAPLPTSNVSQSPSRATMREPGP